MNIQDKKNKLDKKPLKKIKKWDFKSKLKDKNKLGESYLII